MSSLAAAAITTMAISSSNRYWFDIYHQYYRFGSEYTHSIDTILMDPHHGKVGPRIILSPGTYIPGIGLHRYYVHPQITSWNQFHQYVGLEKVLPDDESEPYYLAWICPFSEGQTALQHLESKILTCHPNTIDVVSIDSNGSTPRLVHLRKRCEPARPSQQIVIDAILSSGRTNLKTFIHGPSGCGKSYIGRLLKQSLPSLLSDSHISLYEDIDLFTNHSGLHTMIFSHVDRRRPVVLVINDIARFYRYPNCLPVLDLLDSIDYVFTIYTSSISFEDLSAQVEFRPYLRPGRVDLIAAMTMDTCSIRTNTNVIV